MNMIQLPIDKRHLKDIFRRALNISYRWWVDELDCSKSWCRRPTNMTFEGVLDMIDEVSYYATCTLRTGYGDDVDHYEFCLNTLGHVNYFVWVKVTVNDVKGVINENL